MKDRIKKIRKDAKVNQSEFAASINLSAMMVAKVETESANFSDRSIKDICRVYNVNEEWLRTGQGEPYRQMTINQEIAEFMNNVMEAPDDELVKEFIHGLARLDQNDWKKIANIIKKLKKEDGE